MAFGDVSKKGPRLSYTKVTWRVSRVPVLPFEVPPGSSALSEATLTHPVILSGFPTIEFHKENRLLRFVIIAFKQNVSDSPRAPLCRNITVVRGQTCGIKGSNVGGTRMTSASQ